MRIKKTHPVVQDYLASVSNEINFDSLYFRIINSSPDELGYLPRVPKWISFSQRHLRLMRLLIQVLRFFWIFGGAILFFLKQALQLCSARSKAGAGRFTPSEHGYVFALTERTAEMNMPDQQAMRATWITMSWSPITRLPQGVAHVDYSQILTIRDIALAFLHAIQSVYLLAGKKRQKKWVLQSYTAFHWFTVRAAIDKLTGPVLMTDHFDRWAVLIDSSFARRPATDASMLTLVQHGSVDPVSESAAPVKPTIRLTRRLRAVDELWVYDANSENIFKRDVLSVACSRRITEVRYFKPSIVLTRLDDTEGLRVLFVGYSLCEQVHVALYHRLISDFRLKVYYKPHPRTVMSMQLEDVGWTVLKESTTFPEVDLLISYPSTLVTEYASLSVKSVVHPLDIKAAEIENFYQLVVEAIKKSSVARGRD